MIDLKNPNRFAFARRKSQPGITLVEMVATLSLLLTLSIVAVRMLSSVTEIGRQTAENQRGRASILRLADAMHEDRQSATSMDATDWPLSLETERGEVTYDMDFELQEIRRTLRDSSRAKIVVDRFPLPRRCEPALESDAGQAQIVLMRGKDVSWTIELSARDIDIKDLGTSDSGDGDKGNGNAGITESEKS
ncbi:hypothetical protein Poly51_50440 [Rubripirellula tenax]|uniref:Uncharacterized protein n=1 Tax=Rubripirellula tenax TaxID=2528015 RepID=A0A5C6EFF4_9BACT|nr:hypothetical protein [Rubripirellula tenax]TWU47245.1 hypothetical protein Poly51_50440 [Rubripirellula tenax]